MSDSPTNQFAAPDPALGYLFQVRTALLWSLKKLKSRQDFVASVETLDDVAFEATDGSTAELLQTKHHRNRSASLSDYSTDLWKTLRVWFESRAHEVASPDLDLFLITTGTAPADSAASKLRKENRDVSTAKQLLDSVAKTSKNKDIKPAFDAYLAISDADRQRLLSSITIIDGSATITDLHLELREEVYWAVDSKHISVFLERLEGWWFNKVIRQLDGPPIGRIGSVEIDFQMNDLREQFLRESLPIDEDLVDFILDEKTEEAHSNFVFVKQLELVKVGKIRIAASIRDFYRAFEQRSRWLRDHLVIEMDLDRYEKRLTEAWELIFEAMRDELGDDATDAAMEQAARSVLSWAEKSTLSIRQNMDEPFISRGSFHILADDKRIGWHPEFRERLSALLESGVK